jgi:hypothetical protein
VSTLADTRGLITGPMWAHDEAARRNGSTLVSGLRHGAAATLLVLLAYLAAAWLDEAYGAELAQAGQVAATVSEVA